MRLRDASIVDLLPDSIKHDAQIIAIARAIDSELWAAQDCIDNVLIWSRIDQLGEPILSTIARQMGITIYDGWISSVTQEQKQKLVEIGYILHFFRGTRYALDQVFSILDVTGTVVEWFEPNSWNLQPYEFEVTLDLNAQNVDPNFWSNSVNIINTLKNERSHLKGISVSFAPPNADLFHGAATLLSIELNLTPGPPKPHDPTVTSLIPNQALLLTVVGTADAGNTVTVTFPDSSTGTVIAGSNGQWSLQSTVAQPSGDVTVIAMNPSFGVSDTITVPYTLPTLVPPTVAHKVNPDGSLTVYGEVVYGVLVEVTMPDGAMFTSPIGAFGVYAPPSVNITTNLDGTINITGSATQTVLGNYGALSAPDQQTGFISARVTDGFGNYSAPTVVQYIVGWPNPPTVNITTNRDGTINITGSGS